MDPMIQGQLKEWAVILAVIGIPGWCIYVIAGALRRKQQNEMQKHMLDKFSSAQDFAAFMQSPAGQKYMMSVSETTASPRNTILNAVRTGFVLMFGGAGFLAGGQVDSIIYHIGAAASLAGVGFLCAALVSYFLAKRIGLKEKEGE
jgi:hypothetical protein